MYQSRSFPFLIPNIFGNIIKFMTFILLYRPNSILAHLKMSSLLNLHSINVSVLHHFWLLWLHQTSCDKSFSIDGIITVFKVYWTSSSTRSPEVRHTSFLSSQVFDLLSWFYVYLLDLVCSATLSPIQPHQISFRNLEYFATPLPSPIASLLMVCGSLLLAVNTRGGTFTG